LFVPEELVDRLALLLQHERENPRQDTGTIESLIKINRVRGLNHLSRVQDELEEERETNGPDIIVRQLE
jgi:hypothetical protein